MAALTRLGPLGVTVALALGLVTLAVAAPGDLDPAFGTGGRAVVSPAVESVASAVALQPDGKVVLAGWADDLAPPPPPPPAPDAPVRNSDFLVARLVVRGNLDPTFGSDGSVRTPIDLAGGGTDAAWAVAVGPAGEIYVGGTAHKSGGSDVAIVRYTQGGTLDTGFNGTGIRTVDVHAIDDLYGLAVQPDGKVVAVARGGPGFTVVRIHSSGALDGAFGSGGIVETQVANPGVQDQATAVVLPGDGKIVVAGAADYSFPYAQTDFALVRYLSDGRLDPAFGEDGIVVTPGRSEEVPYGLALAPGAKLVVAGFIDRMFGLARYLPNGALDRTFRGGTVTTSFDGLYASGRSVVAQQDGKVVVGGSMRAQGVGAYDQIALARYDADGSLDTSFGAGGKRTYDVLAGHDAATGLVIQHAATPSGTDRLVVVARGSDGDGASDHMVALGIDLGALGPAPLPARCRVPRVIRLRLSVARRRILRANCRVGRIRRVRARRFPGIVVGQSPRAGRQLSRGSRVRIVVGRR